MNNQTDSILFAGGYSQLGLMTKSGVDVWHTPFIYDNTPGFIQGVGDVDGDGDLDLLSVGHPSAPGVDTQSRFHAYDAKTGTLLWTVNLPGRAHGPVGGAYADTPTLSISGDVDNDGRVESIFAINGTLYVVGANPGGTSGAIEWNYTPDNGYLGSPVLADANGDGLLEIVVVSTSGMVYGIGTPAAALASSALSLTVASDVIESNESIPVAQESRRMPTTTNVSWLQGLAGLQLAPGESEQNESPLALVFDEFLVPTQRKMKSVGGTDSDRAEGVIPSPNSRTDAISDAALEDWPAWNGSIAVADDFLLGVELDEAYGLE
jgi:hypothetical protein